MYIRVKTSPKTNKQSIQIVESIRDGKKVSQKIILHVGQAISGHEADRLKVLAAQLLEQMKTIEQTCLFSSNELAEMVFESRANLEHDNDPIKTL